MSRKMNAADARLKMSEMLNAAQHHQQVVELTRWGKAAACIVDVRVGELVDQLGMAEAARVLEAHIEGHSAGVGGSTGELEVVPAEQPESRSYFYVRVDGKVIPGQGVVLDLDKDDLA